MASILKEIFATSPDLDAKSISFLVNALEKANTPGFDYLEFKEALSAQSKLGIDDTTAFKSTFATASTIGLTKEKLIASTQHYLEVLQNQKQLFDQAVEKRLEEKVLQKEKENKGLEEKVAALQNKIKEMENQLKVVSDQISDNKNGIENEKVKIEKTKDDFEMALNGILSQIQADLDKIENWLK